MAVSSSTVNTIWLAENMDALPSIASDSIPLIYIDPPFNTGKKRAHQRIRVERDESDGDRVGFNGRRYRSLPDAPSVSYADTFDDFLQFLRCRIVELHRVLAPSGSLFFHIDSRESHYCKIMLDEIFGRQQYMNEIVWVYDFGGRSKSRWSAKHDVIFWYTKNNAHYTFRYDDIDRIPYLAPGLVTAEKARRGKTPTDVWWQTIVPTNGHERTGYPTQKPLAVLDRIVRVHSNPGDLVLDCFAGSGTTGVAAAKNDRNYLLIDNNPDATRIMAQRLAYSNPRHVGFKFDAEMTEPRQRKLIPESAC